MFPIGKEPARGLLEVEVGEGEQGEEGEGELEVPPVPDQVGQAHQHEGGQAPS